MGYYSSWKDQDYSLFLQNERKWIKHKIKNCWNDEYHTKVVNVLRTHQLTARSSWGCKMKCISRSRPELPGSWHGSHSSNRPPEFIIPLWRIVYSSPILVPLLLLPNLWGPTMLPDKQPALHSLPWVTLTSARTLAPLSELGLLANKTVIPNDINCASLFIIEMAFGSTGCPPSCLGKRLSSSYTGPHGFTVKS
jgi:hypothetical protein